MSNPIEEHINLYQHFAPNPTAFRESLEGALVYAKNSNKNLNMDLRDYFAAKAMESDIANWSIEAEKTREVGFWGYEEIAKRAYTMANAMMKARKK